MTSGTGGTVRWQQAALSLLILVGLAVALWLADASVHIVQWPASGPTRLALLRPLWHLEIAVSCAVAAAVAVTAFGISLSRFAPLLALWVWVLPYLPWLPDRLPLLLVLAGPLRWVVLAAAVGATFSRWPAVRDRVTALRLPTRGWVFGLGFLAYAASGVFAVHTHGLVGDEPHYLIISESLLKDRDLKIENNHQQKDYRSFFFGELRPDFMQRGVNGEIYSIHAPGLPVLTLPVYAAAGYRGVIVFIALLAALAALAMFDLTERLAGRGAAVVTWLATCVSVPFVPYAWSIFPEMPGAFFVAWSTLWLWEEEERSWVRWAARGAALGFLPWLHTRFVIMSIVFGLAFAWRLRRRPSALVGLAVPAVVSAAAWFYSFYAIYGIWSPEAPYGAYATEFVRLVNIPHGLIGILFDQKFGLFFYSPIYLLAPVGAWWLLRDRRARFQALVLLIVVAAYVGSTTRLYMFWGGSSAPARFLVPILPCLAPMVGIAVARLTQPLWRGCVALWVVIGTGVAVFSMVAPGRLILYSEPHGRARLLEIFQAASPLSLTVPTFTDPDWASFVASLAWWLAIAALAVIVGGRGARRFGAGPWAAVACTTALFVLGGAVLTARPGGEVRRLTAQRGALELLERMDGDAFRTLSYRTRGLAPAPEVRDLATISDVPEKPVPEDGRVLGPLTVPPGRYDARVWFAGLAGRQGEVVVGARGQATFASYTGTLTNPVTVPFEIPITVGRLIVRVTDPDIAATVTSVDIVPQQVVPFSHRDPSPVYAVESLPSRSGALIAYTDEHAFPEHGTFWTRGTAEARLLLAPAGASGLTLFFSSGPNASIVTWRVDGGAEQQTRVGADQEVSVSVPLSPTPRLVPMTVRSNTMFQPGQVDPTSTDMRGLGVRVRPVVE